MKQDQTPLRYAVFVFVVTAFFALFLELILVACGFSEPVVFLCPWGVYEYGSDTLIFVTVACMIGLLAGFFAWLNRTLDDMRNSYGPMITELKMRIQALEEKLENTKKD